MALVKISELSAASALGGTEAVPIVQSGVTVQATSQDIGDLGGVGGGSGALEFISEAVVTGSAATNITFSGLDLDTDSCYLIKCNLGANAAAGIYLFFNGDTTATNYYRVLQSNTTSVSSGRANDSLLVSAAGSDSCPLNIEIRNGVDSLAHWQCLGATGATTTLTGRKSDGHWTNTANVTSVTIHSGTAAAFNIGTYARLYKVLNS